MELENRSFTIGKITVIENDSGNYQFTLPPLVVLRIFDRTMTFGLDRNTESTRDIIALYDEFCNRAQMNLDSYKTTGDSIITDQHHDHHEYFDSILRVNVTDYIKIEFPWRIQYGTRVVLTVEIKWHDNEVITEIIKGHVWADIPVEPPFTVGKIKVIKNESGNYKFTLPPLQIKAIHDQIFLDLDWNNPEARNVITIYHELCNRAQGRTAYPDGNITGSTSSTELRTITQGIQCIVFDGPHQVIHDHICCTKIKSSIIYSYIVDNRIDYFMNPQLKVKFTNYSQYPFGTPVGAWVELNVEIKWYRNSDSRQPVRMITEVIVGRIVEAVPSIEVTPIYTPKKIKLTKIKYDRGYQFVRSKIPPEAAELLLAIPGMRMMRFFDIVTLGIDTSTEDGIEVMALYDDFCNRTKIKQARKIFDENGGGNIDEILSQIQIKSSLECYTSKFSMGDLKTDTILNTILTDNSDYPKGYQERNWIQLTVQVKLDWDTTVSHCGTMKTEIIKGVAIDDPVENMRVS